MQIARKDNDSDVVHGARFDLQGHRGARGLRPENTLAGFERALAIGVTTLETDLAVTNDNVLVLSHDPRLDPAITRGQDGRWLEQEGPAIRALSVVELRRYDVGRIDPRCEYARQFAEQTPVDASRIPLLSELFDLGERSGKAPFYNIETKISPLAPDDTPDAETFARLVVEAVRTVGLEARVTVQSFDWRTLLAVSRLAPQIATVGLTIDTEAESTVRGEDGAPSPWLAGVDQGRVGAAVPELVRAAGCSTWSPYWRDINGGSVALAHRLGLKVVPWTVNDPDDMVTVIALGVDGLITDYPNRGRRVLEIRGLALP